LGASAPTCPRLLVWGFPRLIASMRREISLELGNKLWGWARDRKSVGFTLCLTKWIKGIADNSEPAEGNFPTRP